MATCTLWNQKNYLLDIEYLVATRISEYDIRKANISVLYSEGIISKDYYEYLYSADRMTRQVEVGYMIKNNPEVGKTLANGIEKYRRLFFESNNISDNDVLSIKNDAVFIINKLPNITKFGEVVEFINKNIYSSYIRLQKKEVYFRSDIINNTSQIDIKGISDNKLLLHRDYILTVIADIMYYIEIGEIKSAIDYLTGFYDRYIQRKLPIEYYRNFDDESKYIIHAGTGFYTLDHCNQYMINVVSIETNLNIIRDLYGIITAVYFNHKRH